MTVKNFSIKHYNSNQLLKKVVMNSFVMLLGKKKAYEYRKLIILTLISIFFYLKIVQK